MTTVPSTASPTEQERADRFATDLETFAAFLRANPDISKALAENFVPKFVMYVGPDEGGDAKTAMADVARRARRAGAVMTKNYGDVYAGADLDFGAVGFHVYSKRDEVCTRVVTGTHEEVVEEADPAAVAALPKVKKTVVVEDVTWECGPLIAAESEAVA